MRDINQHLTEDEFIGFFLEDLPEEEAKAVEKHIECCVNCAKELESLYTANEDFPAEQWAKERDAFIAKLREKILPAPVGIWKEKLRLFLEKVNYEVAHAGVAFKTRKLIDFKSDDTRFGVSIDVESNGDINVYINSTVMELEGEKILCSAEKWHKEVQLAKITDIELGAKCTISKKDHENMAPGTVLHLNLSESKPPSESKKLNEKTHCSPGKCYKKTQLAKVTDIELGARCTISREDHENMALGTVLHLNLCESKPPPESKNLKGKIKICEDNSIRVDKVPLSKRSTEMRMMQTFYWDCPKKENKEGEWWNYIKSKVPELAKIGINCLWLPPSAKSSHIDSMGYAPYDFYDQGKLEQKGGTKTWFGSEAELKKLINEAHRKGMSVFGDAVLNHCDIGDEKELNPILNKELYTKYTPKSGKFLRNWQNFHPCDYDPADVGAFYGDLEGYMLPDLCHDNPHTYMEVLNYIGWLRDRTNGIGYDGFRYDAVKYFDSWIVQIIQEWQKSFGVVEYWDGNKDAIKNYLKYIEWTASAFDFPLFYTLREMCNNPNYDMRWIWGNGLIFDIPTHAVTFCENHDTDRSQPIVADKLLAYAFILTHEGVPCIYWRDYFNYGLGMEGTPNGIAKLSQIHRDYAGGSTNLLFADQRLYISQRNGFNTKKGLVIVINNDPNSWRGTWVKTNWENTKMECVAWWGHAMDKPMDKWTNAQGWADFYAAPRGYVIYVPNT